MQFESHGSVVQLGGVESAASEIETKIEREIPGVTRVTDATPDYTVEVDRGDPEVVVGEDRSVLRMQSEQYVVSDVLAFLSRVFERLYLEDGCMSMHSAAVEIDGSAVLLTGPGTAGKTTTAFELCEQYDAGYISGDRTLINSESAVAGEPVVLCKKGSLYYEFDSFDVDLPGSPEDDDGLWQKGITCTHDELGLTQVRGPVDIEAIYSVMRLPIDDRIRVEEFSRIDALWELFNQIAYFSHYHLSLLYGPRSVTPVIEDRTETSKRITLLEELVDTVGCYGITGSMDDMAAFIHRQHGE